MSNQIIREIGSELADGHFKTPNGPMTPGKEVAEQAVRTLLQWVGQDPTSDGLKDTPSRVVRMLDELTSGYRDNPKEILGRVFEDSYDEVVISKDIPFSSLCCHHLLPFIGTVDIGYVPEKKVVGLSKLARLVDCFAHRLQIQEQLTRQVAEAIRDHLSPVGVAVVVRAQHSCMCVRGVKKSGSMMVTSVMNGCFRTDQAARAEFLNLCR